MFLNATLKRNPALIRAALEYHQSGAIPPNTYLLDYDAVRDNARLLSEASRETGVSLYFITKQIGHNPLLLRAIREGGLLKGTSIDTTEAFTLASNGVTLGNVGHLTQIPLHDITRILRLNPEHLTVFGYEKAEQIIRAAADLKQEVHLLLRVFRPGDYFYPGQVGGIALEDVADVARRISQFSWARVSGVTSYPCLIYDDEKQTLETLPNLETVLLARERLERELGYALRCVNAPGTTCVSALRLLADHGITHAEPGHALTGTTPLAASGDQPETSALVYVSEVSHIQGRDAYIYGGGFYHRSRVQAALIGTKPEDLAEAPVRCSQPDAEMIDYYGMLHDIPQRVRVGDTVIAAFRTQIFVTRSYVAVVKGLSTGEPSLFGLWDSRGRRVEYGVQTTEFDRAG